VLSEISQSQKDILLRFYLQDPYSRQIIHSRQKLRRGSITEFQLCKMEEFRRGGGGDFTKIPIDLMLLNLVKVASFTKTSSETKHSL
jgi:hypothetical protein